jgi:hypothetical protein
MRLAFGTLRRMSRNVFLPAVQIRRSVTWGIRREELPGSAR